MSGPRHIHFVGIGGVGVSALAQVALAQGATVTGSDLLADPRQNLALGRLEAGGARIFTGHRQTNVGADTDLVVVSAAIGQDNPEIRVARERALPVISRAEMLGKLMSDHAGTRIAVAGTHGKTTSTAMIGLLLQNAGLDPTVFVGGEADQLGGNVRIGSKTGPFVAEACEAYDSFLHLYPDIAVVTNVESDHLDHFGTWERLLGSFRSFAANIARPRGALVFCADDPASRQLVATLSDPPRTLSFAIDDVSADVRCSGRQVSGCSGGSVFTLVTAGEAVDVELRVPGRHNVLNALAAATVARELGIRKEVIAAELGRFSGVERRQQIVGLVPAGLRGDVLVIDDYAHHPTEIRETIQAMRDAYPMRRLVTVFQPHLYSRTRDFLDEFAAALSRSAALVVTDVYAARETPIRGVSAADIVSRAVERNPALPAVFVQDKSDVPAALGTLVRPGDLVLFLGAGDIGEQAELYVRTLHAAGSPLS